MKSVYALMIAAACLGGCKKSGGGGGTTGNGVSTAAAKEMLGAYLKPGADAAALSAALQPKPEDYAAVFNGDAVQKIQAQQSPLWEGGKLKFKPSAEQTELLISAAPQSELLSGTGNATHCHKGLRDLAPKMNPNVVVYCFRFVKPGERTGLNIDGLVQVNGHWALFVRPWLAFGERPQQPQP